MTRHIVFRELGSAVSHASCESPAALDSAIEHAERGLQALRELRAGLDASPAAHAARVGLDVTDTIRRLRRAGGEG